MESEDIVKSRSCANIPDWFEEVITGRRYNTLMKASEDLGVSCNTIRRSLMTGEPIRGNRYFFKHIVQKCEEKSENKKVGGLSIDGCFLLALKVDFLQSKNEVRCYAKALYEAAKWGGIADGTEDC